MSVEKIIIILIWVIGCVGTILITPRNRYRRLLFALLLCQCITWPASLIIAEFGRISFPVREFPRATDLLVTTEYFFYPLLCGLYIIFEPKRGYLIRLIYLTGWVSMLALFAFLLEKYTRLLTYTHYSWMWTGSIFFIIFAFTNIVYQWFFKSKACLTADREAAK